MSEVWASETKSGTELGWSCVAGAGTSPDAWAHASCDSRHKGCVGVGFNMIQKAGAYIKIAKAQMDRQAHAEQLLNESRWEALPDSDSEKGEEEEWSFDKAGKKKYGPKTDYTIGGCVQAV